VRVNNVLESATIYYQDGSKEKDRKDTDQVAILYKKHF
jgi:hypothetical protein